MMQLYSPFKMRTSKVTNMHQWTRLICALFIIHQTQAATNIGGVYLQNTIWTATGSANPYYLINDVQIPRNVTLTIQQGVQIDFSLGDFEILVHGIIKIQGTAAQPVVLKNGFINHLKYMINIQRASLSNSSINYTRFKGPKRALQLTNAAAGLQQNNGTLLLKSSNFTDNTTIAANGYYPRYGNPLIPTLEFRSCYLNQTTVLSVNSESELIRITNSTIHNGIFYPRTGYEGMQIINSTIKNITVIYDTGSGHIQLIDSNLINGTVLRQVTYYPGVNFTVIRSVVNGLSFDGSGYVYSYGTGNLNFQTSTMLNIVITGISSYYYYYSYQSFMWAISIDNCNFTGGNLTLGANTGTSVSIRNSRLNKVNISSVDPNNYYYGYSSDSLTIRNTTFTAGIINTNSSQVDIIYSNVTLVQPPLTMGQNSRILCSSIGRALTIAQTNTIGINGSSLVVDRSTIKDFATAIRIAAPYINAITITNTNFLGISDILIDNKGPYDILAYHNYWGTNNVGTINSKILDYWDNINYGEVLYTNYSSSALGAEKSCPPYTENWVPTTPIPYWATTQPTYWGGISQSTNWGK